MGTFEKCLRNIVEEKTVSGLGRKYEYDKFVFELNAPPGQSYGELLLKGNWLGQVGDLAKKENPYECAVLLGHVLAWYPLVDFTGVFDIAKLIFVTSHQQIYQLRNRKLHFRHKCGLQSPDIFVNSFYVDFSSSIKN